MADTLVNEPKISIKAIVDKENDRVLYVEADYTFVDILFSFMTFPMGAIVRLLGEEADKKFEALGSLNNLYHSLVDLPECFFLSEECKLMLVNPRSPSYDHCRNLKLKIDDTEPTKYFVCENFHTFPNKFSNCNTSKCSTCGNSMDREIRFKHNTDGDDNNNVGRAVFVSDIATFIVTDDLCVMPHTHRRCIQLLTDLGVTDSSHLEERTVEICRGQILHLLRLSLLFNAPLTYVVLLKTPPSRGFNGFEKHKFDDRFASIQKEESTSSTMVLQVSLQKSTGKLLFAEAEDDFIDFVFGFLAISLGTVIGRLMNGTSSLVCMDNLYRSISDMSGICFKSHNMKDILLKPHFGQPYSSKNQIFSINGSIFPKLHMTREAGNCAKNWYDNYILTYGEGQAGLNHYSFHDPRIGGEYFKRSEMFMRK